MNSLETILTPWQPRILSVLRIMAGLLLLQHGLSKHLSFPVPFPNKFEAFQLLWFAGAIEMVGGILLVLGLFTRWTAFVCSGFVAVAYFMSHAPKSFYPIANGGELAVLYCFVFFYLFFAGGGAWSIDALAEKAMGGQRRLQQQT